MTTPHPEASQRSYLRNRIAYLMGIWIFACVFLWQALSLPPPSRPTPVSAATFPTIVAVAMVLAATGMLVSAIWVFVREGRTAPEPAEPGTASPEELELSATGPNGEERVASRRRLLIALAATGAYVVLFFPLGYLLSTLLFLGGMSAYIWRRPLPAILIAVVLTAGIGWLFSLLGIPLPSGPAALPF
jgi:hypothetical protein